MNESKKKGNEKSQNQGQSFWGILFVLFVFGEDRGENDL